MPLAKLAAISRDVDHRAHRVAVADRLAHDDDIGDDVLGLEGPEVGARAAESRLHLVGDAHAARRADVSERLFEITLRRNDLAAARLKRLREERGNGLTRLRDHAGELGRVRLSRRAALPLVRAAVAVGQRHDVDPWLWPTAAAPAHELVGTRGDERRRVAVVGAIDDEQVPPLRVGHRQPERELVRLRAGVDEETRIERRRQRRRRAVSRTP